FIEVEPATLRQHLLSSEPAGHQLGAMSDYSGRGKPGNIPIRNRDRFRYVLGEKAKTRSEHHGDPRPPAAQSLANGFRGGFDVLRCSLVPARRCTGLPPRFPAYPPPRRQSRIPAIVADRKFAS